MEAFVRFGFHYVAILPFSSKVDSSYRAQLKDEMPYAMLFTPAGISTAA